MVTWKHRTCKKHRDILENVHCFLYEPDLTKTRLRALTFTKLWGIPIVRISKVEQKVGQVSTDGNGKDESGAYPEWSWNQKVVKF